MITRLHVWWICLLGLASCQKTEETAARRSDPVTSASAATGMPQVPIDAGTPVQTGGHGLTEERSSFTTRKITIEGRVGFVVEGRSTPGKLWTPPDSTLAEFERMFPESAPGNQKELRRIDKYLRQYWGRELAPNHHEIEIDFFCETPKDIDRKPYMGFDGLGCNTVVFYDPERRQIEVQGQDVPLRIK